MDILNALVLFANFVFIPATAYGTQLALGALGLTVVFSILRFSNIAHGDTMAFGTALTILGTWALQAAGITFGPLPTALLALPLGIAGAIALVLVTDRYVYRYYRRLKVAPVVLMIVSIGLMFIMNGLNRFILGTEEVRFDDGTRFLVEAKAFKEWSGLAEGLAIRSTQALSLVVALVVVVALFWFLHRTRTGKAMRAYSDNEDLALLSGINPDRVVLIAWVLATTLATVAGVLYGLDKSYKAFTYFQILLPIFAAAIVGGIGSPAGAVAGGFIVAYSEVMVTYAYKKFLAYLVPGDWAPEGLVQLLSTEYKVAVSFIILVMVLLVRPTGLFRGKVI